MNPITGPYTYLHQGTTLEPYYERRVGYRQAKPFNLPLPLDYRRNYGVSTWSHDASWGGSYAGSGFNGNYDVTTQPNYAQYREKAYSQAYERLVSQLRDQQGWGESLAQWRASRKTIIESATSLAASALAIRRGKFLTAMHVLGLSKPSRRVSQMRRRSGDWLAWTYAINPTISDVQAAIKTIVGTQYYTTRRLRGSSRSFYQYFATATSNTSSGGNNWWSSSKELSRYSVSVRHQLDARIDNPNFFLSTTAGFTTATLPLDLVPLSFILDWFTNLGTVIGSISDFNGVTVTNAHSTEFARGYKVKDTVNGASSASPPAYWQDASNDEFRGVFCNRILGVPQPSFVIYPFEGLSLHRAANAIALIVSIFGK